MHKITIFQRKAKQKLQCNAKQKRYIVYMVHKTAKTKDICSEAPHTRRHMKHEQRFLSTLGPSSLQAPKSELDLIGAIPGRPRESPITSMEFPSRVRVHEGKNSTGFINVAFACGSFRVLGAQRGRRLDSCCRHQVRVVATGFLYSGISAVCCTLVPRGTHAQPPSSIVAFVAARVLVGEMGLGSGDTQGVDMVALRAAPVEASLFDAVNSFGSGIGDLTRQS